MGFLDILIAKNPDFENLVRRSDVKGLLKISHHKNREHRYTAAVSLGKIRDSSAVEPLIRVLLNDLNNLLRIYAAVALGHIGDARAVEPLITALGDTDKEVRSKAAEALGRIGDSRAVEPLIAALRSTEGVSAFALVKIGNTRVLELLATALTDSDKKTCFNVAYALERLGVPAFPLIISAFETSPDIASNFSIKFLEEIYDQTGGAREHPIFDSILKKEECSKCGGKGSYWASYGNMSAPLDRDMGYTVEESCRACDGKGYLVTFFRGMVR